MLGIIIVYDLHFKWFSEVALWWSIVKLAPSAGCNLTVETLFTGDLHPPRPNTTPMNSMEVKQRIVGGQADAKNKERQ